MRRAASLVGGAIALLLAGCYDPPIPHVPPQTPSGKFEAVASGVSIECMQRRMKQNLIRNGFQLVATDAQSQIVSDKGAIRTVYHLAQERMDVRVLVDQYTIGSDGKIAPMEAKETTQLGQINFQKAIDSVVSLCRG